MNTGSEKNEGVLSKEYRISQIAKICHETNRAYCETIGDYSQPKWEDAAEWQRESARNGVNYHLENTLAKPEDSHNNWMKLKIEEGWVYGEEKNPEAKTHPCIVPYSELPDSQKIKDSLFIGVVNSFRFLFI